MSDLETVKNNLVAANRILAHEGIFDAYGHVSMRHPTEPDKMLLSRSRSPELVEPEDIMIFTFDGKPADGRSDPAYYERFIHCGIYEARPDIMSVVHSHASSVLPFSISDVKLVPVIHTAASCGCEIPVWDSETNFGATNLLVANVAQGRDLAKTIGPQGRAALMRGHGFTAAGRTLAEALRIAIYLPENAAVMMDAIKLGGRVKALTPGEMEIREAQGPDGSDIGRALAYWAKRAGCSHYLNYTPST
ncbi:MAG: class II aldolase/adducin family protein [Beijerinckiaceae bacterium]